MSREDKTIVKEDESHAHGPKKDPVTCAKSPTGEHVWNYSARPDNQRLGICRYCDIQRIFPGALIPAAKPLPPPMPAAQPLALPEPKKPVVAPPTPPAPKITPPRQRKERSKPNFRTPVEKLSIITEYRAASTKRGGKRAVLQKYNISNTVLASWLEREEDLRKLAGVGMEPLPKKQPANHKDIPFEERLKIIEEYQSGKLGDKAAVCDKYKITKDTFDNWMKRQAYYRSVIEHGTKAVHSETGKRTATLKKLHQLEDLPVEEAIDVLKDWRDILHIRVTALENAKKQ
jgi:hypothetical protein